MQHQILCCVALRGNAAQRQRQQRQRHEEAVGLPFTTVTAVVASGAVFTAFCLGPRPAGTAIVVDINPIIVILDSQIHTRTRTQTESISTQSSLC
jgi:hypothetical protein